MSNSIGIFFDYCLPVARWILPPACLLCGGSADGAGLCKGCAAALPRLGTSRCPVCALPNATGERCGRCLRERPQFDRVVAAFSYEFPATALIHRLKYRGELACARPLAFALAQTLEREPYPDLVVPMPLARARLADRGFNQCVEIGRYVAADFGLHLSTALCRRTRQVSPQAALPWKQRSSNVRGVFACDQDLHGKTVAVIDDVLTTGASLNELARTLKLRGAQAVTGWIVARTPAPGDG